MMSAPCSIGAHEIGRGQRVVDDERHARLFGHRGNGFEVGDDAAGIGDRLDEDRLGLGRERGAERVGVGRIGPPHLPAAFLEGMGELVDRPAIELARGDELVARREQSMEYERLRRVARGHGKSRRAAFERRHPLLQHRLGRVHDAGIDVAESLEIEQRRRVLDIVEHEGRGLIDRRGAGAGRRIGLGAGMDGKRIEAGLALSGHRHVPLWLMVGPTIARNRFRLWWQARGAARLWGRAAGAGSISCGNSRRPN